MKQFDSAKKKERLEDKKEEAKRKREQDRIDKEEATKKQKVEDNQIDTDEEPEKHHLLEEPDKTTQPIEEDTPENSDFDLDE